MSFYQEIVSTMIYLGYDKQLPLDMVSAGDHCERRMSRQMEPLLFILGW